MDLAAELLRLVVGQSFGATDLLAIGLGLGMVVMLVLRRPSRTSASYFVGMMSVFAAVLLLLRNYYEHFYLAHLVGPVHWTVGWLLNMVGYPVEVTSTSLATDTYAIHLAPGCSGASFIAVFAVAIAIYPTAWRTRAWGLTLGLVTVLALNLIRFGTLLWIGSHYPTAMHTAKDIHAYVFVLILVGLYWTWLTRFARREATLGEPRGPDTPADPSPLSSPV